jgi:hypothetical protein
MIVAICQAKNGSVVMDRTFLDCHRSPFGLAKIVEQLSTEDGFLANPLEGKEGG